MKKLMLLILTVIMLSFTTISFADMGAPEFEYDVYVGLSGWSVVMNYPTGEYDVDDLLIWGEKTVTFSPGTKITVGAMGDDEYMFDNPNNEDEYAFVSKADIDKNTIEVGKIIGKEVGTVIEAIECKVNTADSDLTMRIGPAKGFPSVCGIPKDTEITYETIYKNGDTTWAFVSYNGKEGWVNSEYLVEVVEEEVTDIAPPKDEPEVEKVGMSKTEIIIISIIGALIVALTALLIILIIKRRNSDREQ